MIHDIMEPNNYQIESPSVLSMYCTAVSCSRFVIRPAQGGENTCSEMAAMFRGFSCEWKVYPCVSRFIWVQCVS